MKGISGTPLYNAVNAVRTVKYLKQPINTHPEGSGNGTAKPIYK